MGLETPSIFIAAFWLTVTCCLGPAVSNLGNHAPQVFEQLFQAYEQRLPRELADKAEDQGWLDPREVPADACPAERQLQISYNQTPQVRLHYLCCALVLESC